MIIFSIQISLFQKDASGTGAGAGVEPVLPWCLLRTRLHFDRFENRTLHRQSLGLFPPKCYPVLILVLSAEIFYKIFCIRSTIWFVQAFNKKALLLVNATKFFLSL